METAETTEEQTLDTTETAADNAQSTDETVEVEEEMVPVSVMKERLAREKQRYETELANKVTKAEKLAQMSEKERAEVEENDRIKALDEKEKELNLREYRYQAKHELETIDLSDKFVDMVLSEDVEQTNKNILALKAEIDKEVERKVTERLKGKPTQTGVGPSSLTKAEITRIENQAERQKAIAENMHLFKK